RERLDRGARATGAHWLSLQQSREPAGGGERRAGYRAVAVLPRGPGYGGAPRIRRAARPHERAVDRDAPGSQEHRAHPGVSRERRRRDRGGTPPLRGADVKAVSEKGPFRKRYS